MSKSNAKAKSPATTPRKPVRKITPEPTRKASATTKAAKAKPTGKTDATAKTKTKTKTKTNAAAVGRPTAKEGSRLVDQKIQSLGDWRAQTLSAIRRLIREAAPGIVEDCKWVKTSNPLGVPVWSAGGIICTGEAYREVVKLTFARGASLDDPRKLFNSSLDAGTRRAIDIREGEALDPKAFKALILAAVEENGHSTDRR